MATTGYEKPVLDLSLPVAADYSAKQFYAMTQNSSGQALLASTAGEKCIGILQDDPAVAGQAGLVRVLGVTKAILGGTVAYDDDLTVDANGKLVAVDANDDFVVGRALSSGVSNDIIPVLVGGMANSASTDYHGSIVSIPVKLANVADGDIVTTYTPGFAGTIEKFSFIVTDAVTTAAKASTLNIEIGTTNLTGGSLALTSANCTPLGAVIDATAITAANAFTATDTISIEASSTTAFIEGEGVLMIVLK